MHQRTEVGKWKPIRAVEKAPIVGREETESSVLKVKEGEDSKNEFSLVRKRGSDVKARFQN